MKVVNTDPAVLDVNFLLLSISMIFEVALALIGRFFTMRRLCH
jgi:hypothetical protein